MWQMALGNSPQKNIGKRDSAWAIPEVQCQVIEFNEAQKNNTKRQLVCGRGALIFPKKKNPGAFSKFHAPEGRYEIIYTVQTHKYYSSPYKI